MLPQQISIIIREFQEKINEITANLSSHLINGEMVKFEEDLYQSCTDLYSEISLAFIDNASKSAELEKLPGHLHKKKVLVNYAKMKSIFS